MKDFRNKDYMILVTAFLSAVKVLLSSRGIIIGNDVINAIADIVAIAIVLFGIWKNTYTTKKSKAQKSVLKQKGLM